MTTKQQPKANPLGASAMLVCISVHQWGNRTVEQAIADQVAVDHAAEKGSFFATKRLVGKDAIHTVTASVSAFKTHHYKNTLPWLDNGQRILPAANYFTYVEGARKLQQEAMNAVDQFIKVYPAIRQAAEKRLGRAFREEDYPSPSELKRKWGIQTHFTPIPDKADFRIDIPAKELRAISKNVDDQVKRAIENAQHDLFQRLYSVVEAMSERLKAYKSYEKKGKRQVENNFKASVVENIRELCTDVLPRLNFTNNPDLTRLCEEAAAKLGLHNADALREDETLRKSTAEAADDILAKMADYIS